MKLSSWIIWPFNEEGTSWARKIPETWTSHPQLLRLALENLKAIVSSFLSCTPVLALLSWQMKSFEFDPCLRNKNYVNIFFILFLQRRKHFSSAFSGFEPGTCKLSWKTKQISKRKDTKFLFLILFIQEFHRKEIKTKNQLGSEDLLVYTILTKAINSEEVSRQNYVKVNIWKNLMVAEGYLLRLVYEDLFKCCLHVWWSSSWYRRRQAIPSPGEFMLHLWIEKRREELFWCLLFLNCFHLKIIFMPKCYIFGVAYSGPLHFMFTTSYRKSIHYSLSEDIFGCYAWVSIF